MRLHDQGRMQRWRRFTTQGSFVVAVPAALLNLGRPLCFTWADASYGTPDHPAVMGPWRSHVFSGASCSG